MVTSNKKASTLAILKVLIDYSDEEHYLTQKAILEHVNNIYHISLDRKTVSSNIELLEDFDFDIQHNPDGKGVALISRLFDDTQIQYLIDSIYSSHSIGPNHARELISILENTLSKYKRKNYSTIYKNYDGTRTDNNQLFSNIMMIQEAITKNRLISFLYMDYDIDGNLKPRRKKHYTVSPYYLINNFGKYYLLCSIYTFQKIFAFRIDFMKDVSIRNIEATPKKSLPFMKDFDIQAYLSSHIYMMGENEIKVKLLLEKESAITTVYDWFGKNAICYTKDNLIYADVTTTKESIIYWALQYGEQIKILSPDEVVNSLKELIDRLEKKYSFK